MCVVDHSRIEDWQKYGMWHLERVLWSSFDLSPPFVFFLSYFFLTLCECLLRTPKP